MNYLKQLITILGPTASGKTGFAANLAAYLIQNGQPAEIISADSRQVFRGMTIGTGKDLDDYVVTCQDGLKLPVPYHLIDICEPGVKYNIHQFQQDFLSAYNDCISRGVRPILCGGSGLYIESVLHNYILPPKKTEAERERHHRDRPLSQGEKGRELDTIILGTAIDRELRREKITARLKTRLEEGMVDEIRNLLETVPADDLIYYGLEYKYVTEYVIGKLSYDEMFRLLEIAIHQFAKRQMTWFRGMERRGFTIHWIDATAPMEEKIRQAVLLI